MGSDVVLSAALRNNLLSLQNTQRNIDTTQLRLATGLKVNSALDNPQNFFTAQSLNNRATDLGRLLDGINQSIRTIEEANTGVNALSDLINQAESVALEAQSEIRAAEGFARIRGDVDLRNVTDITTLTGVDNADNFSVSVVVPDFDDGTGTITLTATVTISSGNTVDSIVAAINSNTTATANGTQFNELVRASVTSGGQLEIRSLEENAVLRVADGGGTLGAAGFSSLGLDTVIDQENVETASTAVRQAGTAIAGRTIYSAVSGATQVNNQYQASDILGGAAGAGVAGFFTATGADVSVTITIDDQQTQLGRLAGTDSIQDLIDLVNNAGIDDVSANFNTDTGRVELEFGDTVGQAELQFSGAGAATGGTLNFGFGTGATDVATGTNTVSEQFTFVGTSADLEQYEEDFNNIRTQIDNLVEDAQYRGINLLAGDSLETFFNEDRDNTLLTEGVDFTALGLGIAEAAFTDAQDIQISLDQARTALGSVRTFGQSIANDLSIIQIRRDFTEQTINTLQAGADDLTVADQNEEGANLLALQTRQQLGVTSLSLAAQSQQSVLRLF